MAVIPSASELLTASYFGRSEVNPNWYRFFSDIPAVSALMRTFLSTDTVAGALSVLEIQNSTYVPTLYNTTNIDASTANSNTYLRVYGTVFVFGSVDIDPTAASAATLLGMSLPVASNFASGAHLGGVAAAAGVHSSVRIFANPTDDRASFSYVAQSASNTSFNFLFAYRVI